MTALYALPDHEVVARLIPGIAERRLSLDEARARIREQPGFVPAAIDPADGGRVYWIDIGAHPFRHWQYVFTIRHLAQEGGIRDFFSCSVEILDDDALFCDFVPVRGLIFHVSRCGSTLLTKALGRLEEHLMISQGAPLQRGFWAFASDEWSHPIPSDPPTLRRLANLIRAMCRRRVPGERAAFVKFISWNILHADLIRRALPGVPAIFMYRDPVEVIASVRKETTAALVAKQWPQSAFLTGLPFEQAQELDDVSYLAHCYRRYFEVALDLAGPDFRLLAYGDVRAENLDEILERGLGLSFDEAALACMREQFAFHSKDDDGRTRFADDRARKRAMLTSQERRICEDICGNLLERLDLDPHNLFVSGRGYQQEPVARMHEDHHP